MLPKTIKVERNLHIFQQLLACHDEERAIELFEMIWWAVGLKTTSPYEARTMPHEECSAIIMRGFIPGGIELCDKYVSDKGRGNEIPKCCIQGVSKSISN